jgi:choline dehydrogenase
MGVSRGYVIVGAGSAGCAVASRLAEDPDVTVTVLEAGPPDTDSQIEIPLAFGMMLKSRIDWDLASEPEPGLDLRRTYVPRGKVLGGSSSLNAMVYMRGNRADYYEWEALGASGWGYEDVLPYFKRAEDNSRGANDYHGVGGPLSVTDHVSPEPFVDTMLEAGLEYGLEANADPNGASQDGVGRWQATIRDGRRCSAAKAYLHPAVARGNVDVVTDALVTRILFEGKRAVGAEFLKDDALHQVRAEHEVIVSAGAYGSPQLLLLSGIGPAGELASHGIDVREELPVGRGLQDHLVVSGVWLTGESALLAGMTPENMERYQRDGGGPYSSNGAEGGAFVRTRDGLDAPDVQCIFAPLALHEELIGPLPGPGYTLSSYILKPASRGSVTLRTPLPHSKPRILHNYLAAEDDRRSMIEGLRFALAVNRQPALQSVRAAPFLVPESNSEADLLDFIQRRAHTVYHPTSTCAIGQVVDPELRVYGFNGLRVADASVMPTVPRGNTNAPAIMVGEKAADLIRGLPPLPRRDRSAAAPA